MIIVELIEVMLESMLILISPEKTAEKVIDINTRKPTKRMLIFLFTLIYVATLVGLVFSLVLISDILYKLFVVMLIIFLLYCLFTFYNRILKKL